MPGPAIDLVVYPDEAALLDGLRRHDPDACTCMVKRFAPLVYARALQLTGDPDEAESVLQLTFIKACEALDSFAGASGLGTWLYRIATNEGLMLLRRRRPHVPLDDLAETLAPADLARGRAAWPPDPQRAALDGELRAELGRALADLPDSLRSVVVLRDIQGLSTDEAAAQLGLSPGAVKVRLHRARLRLREALAAYLRAPGEAP